MATELSLISENRPPSASVGGPITSALTPPQYISIPARKTSVSAPSSRTPRKNVLYVRVLFGSPETKTVSTGKASNTSRKPPMWSASGLLTTMPSSASTPLLRRKSTTLEAAPIGGQLFAHDTSRSDCAAISPLLDTYATRLLAQPLRPFLGPSGVDQVALAAGLYEHTVPLA